MTRGATLPCGGKPAGERKDIYMEFYDLVRQNRSYRGFDERREISWKELTELVDCARMTPSGANRQPLKYDLVHDRGQVAQVLKMTRWAAALPERHLPDPGKGPTAFVILLQETEWARNEAACQRDVGIVAQTLLLAAVEKDLGGLMIGNFDREGLKRIRRYPDHLVPQLVIALGKPAERIILTEVGEDGNTSYFRDAEDVHYVPKRRLQDVIWGENIRQEKSCGAVVFRREAGQIQYLMEHMVQGHCSLPKGHVEGAETEQETARREIREETNLEVDLIPGFRKVISYAPAENCLKEVVFFLAEARPGEMAQQETEVASLSWEPFEEALQSLTYPSDREMLKAADCFLTER